MIVPEVNQFKRIVAKLIELAPIGIVVDCYPVRVSDQRAQTHPGIEAVILAL